MNRCSGNTTKNCKSEANTRIVRECNCHDSFKRIGHSHSPPADEWCPPRCNTIKTKLKPCMKKTSQSSSSNTNSKNCTQSRDRSPSQHIPEQRKTWFQVLVDSPKKAKPEKILHTARPKVDIPVKYNNVLKMNVNDKDSSYQKKKLMRRIHMLVELIYDKISETSDMYFLKLLTDINHMFQKANAIECYRKCLNPEPWECGADLHFNKGHLKFDDEHKYNIVTDDDKRKFNKPVKSETKVLEKSDISSDITLRALVKLLENMKTVTEKAEDQQILLENLTKLVGQIREENKMINKLKDIRIDLESKLASLSLENQYLKQQFESSERERTRTNRLLEIKQKEIECLKKHITSIKGTIAGKINHDFNDIEDQSLELKHLNDTIASLPSHEQSFDMFIRPASSSPADEFFINENQRSEPKIQPTEKQRFENEDSGIQSNTPEHLATRIREFPSSSQEPLSEGLFKLRDNIKKTVEDLQTDLKAHDVSLNLSDITYKWNSN